MAVTTASPAVVGCLRGCVLPPAACYSITSIIQSFVNKCNNSNSCKLFYLDYKSANSQMTSNATQGASFRLAGLSARKYCLFCIQHIYFVMSDGPCWETKSLIWNHLYSCHPSAFVQVSSRSRHRKRPDDQVCIGEDFYKLAKYE